MSGGLGATYRVQLGPDLGFDAVAAHVDYFAALGVESLYCSPVQEAVPGSTHGYDGTDPSRVRAELGGREGFGRLGRCLSDAGIGCVVDIVPNHLSTWPGGPWWRDVLEHGEESLYAEVFDVDWDAGAGKVALPLLDRPLHDALAARTVTLEPVTGVLRVGDVTLPIRGGVVRAGDEVMEVLAAQSYRLVDWHDRADRNYRRFFDVDGLVGVRVERPEVFARTHGLIGQLVSEGLVTAVRVDHVDGLADPARYLQRLDQLTGGLPVVVEKILTGDERLRDSWCVAGTTGYEVMDDIGGALVDPAGLERLAAASADEGEHPVALCTAEARRLVARTSFPTELRRLAAGFAVDEGQLVTATTHLPVYRTYLDGDPVHPDDAAAIAVATAGDAGLRAHLAGPAVDAATMAWQQITGAVMAKGVEDTAWYRLPGRLAFCEVGGDPERSRRDGVERLHSRAAIRAADGRAGLVPTSTHDTKHSGDARARLYALTELTVAFEAGLGRFRSLIRDAVPPLATASKHGDGGDPGAAESRRMAQSLLAVLPTTRPAPEVALTERVGAATVKAAREAKLRTSWDAPDLPYERCLGEWVAVALANDAAIVREAFGAVVDDCARLGATLSLSAVLIRSTLPGVPDCYQGDEIWNLALVDPDNRRSVDFAALGSRLSAVQKGASAGSPESIAQLRRSWRSGDVKLHVTAAALRARQAAPDALAPSARYTALVTDGAEAPSLLAFARGPAGRSGTVIAIATRLPGRLDAATDDLPAGPLSYSTSQILAPAGAATHLVDVLTGREIVVDDGRLAAAEVLADLPVALLVPA